VAKLQNQNSNELLQLFLKFGCQDFSILILNKTSNFVVHKRGFDMV